MTKSLRNLILASSDASISIEENGDGYDLKAPQAGTTGQWTPLSTEGNANVTQGAAVTIPMDGGAFDPYTCIPDSPPSWMDDAGNITEPGLYTFTVYVGIAVVPTTPNQLVYVLGIYNADAQLVVPAATFPEGHTYGLATETISLVGGDAGDLPFNVGGSLQMPTDATGQMSVYVNIVQLASQGA